MFEIFEHTADVGLRVRAGDLNQLFAEAGRGLSALLIENLETIHPQEEIAFQLQAADLEDLLHDWLTELLYTFESKRLVLVNFDVAIEQMTLRAHAAGEKLDQLKHQVGQEIKAVTYHGLFVKPDSDEWLAEVILDL